MKRTAQAKWNGTLKDGNGTMKYGGYEGNYSFASRFENGEGTNPEELIGAAHAGCFSMAFSGELGKAGHNPESIETTAEVTLEKKGDGFAITAIHLNTEGKVPGIDNDSFQKIARAAKDGCPVSNALKGVDISVSAKLA